MLKMLGGTIVTFYELICCNKLYSATLGYVDRKSVTKHEAKTALDALKSMTDNRDDWRTEQKEQYKALIEIAKALLEN